MRQQMTPLARICPYSSTHPRTPAYLGHVEGWAGGRRRGDPASIRGR